MGREKQMTAADRPKRRQYNGHAWLGSDLDCVAATRHMNSYSLGGDSGG